jgi:transposase
VLAVERHVQGRASRLGVCEIIGVDVDAACASYANMNLIAQHGATPFILFKSGTTANRGGAFQKMFHNYSLKRDEFLADCHKRSNVETTFSLIKAKFTDSLRSKTDVATVNEALCRILCHNLCCLIQSAHELGITATFWQNEATPVAETAQEADLVEAWALV